MIQDVTTRFDGELRRVFKTKPEILGWLLKHERKQMCINRLCEQIIKAEGLVIKVSLANYDTLIRDIARMFARNAIQHHEEQNISSAEKIRRQTEADKIKIAEEMMQDLEKEALKDEETREAWTAHQIQKGILRPSR